MRPTGAAGLLVRFLCGGLSLVFRHLMSALEAVLALDAPVWKVVAPPALGLAASWLLYVPAHELLHVAGCLVTGGSVTELRLDPIHGARLLRRVFPFIVPSTEYAGRLSGFSTGGSDLRLLATDLAPYLLTILIGVPLLRAAAAPSRSWLGWRRWAFGPAALLAAAPFISLTGDYYEIGSTLLTMPLPADYERLRSDDLFRLIGEMGEGDLAAPPRASWLVILLSLAMGLCLAGWTYALGAAFDSIWSRRRLRGASAPPSPGR